MVSLRMRIFQSWFRFSRSMTLGARAAVLNAHGEIVLIRHSYTPGWYMPGGGVEHNEPVLEAMRRELREEAGIALTGKAELVGVFSNHKIFPNDHVVLYKVEAGQWEQADAEDDGEIEEIGWFSPHDLPEDASPGTKRRLAALFGDGPDSHFW